MFLHPDIFSDPRTVYFSYIRNSVPAFENIIQKSFPVNIAISGDLLNANRFPKRSLFYPPDMSRTS